MANVSETLSFDDLSAVYRIERKSSTISNVRRDLYPAMASLLISLRLEYEKQLGIDPESLICEGVNLRRKRASKLSKEITEMRMQKISTLANLGAMGRQNILDALTLEEKEYYNGMLELSKRHVGLVDRLSGKRKYEVPSIDREPVITGVEHIDVTPLKEDVPELPAEMPPYVPDEDLEPAEEEHIPESDEDIGPKEEIIETPVNGTQTEFDMIVVRVLEDLPPFSGPDRNYDLKKEDIVRMPKMMAEALINREKAIPISPAP